MFGGAGNDRLRAAGRIAYVNGGPGKDVAYVTAKEHEVRPPARLREGSPHPRQALGARSRERLGQSPGRSRPRCRRPRVAPGAALSSAAPMDASSALQRLFGFSEFRRGQPEAVAAALQDRDALVVMPTGAGKSLCYQLPALMRDDLTIVVSPLVALMHDQAWAIHRIAPGTVTMVNAQRSGAANAQAMERVRAGEVRLLYVAPERFGSPAFARALGRHEGRPVRRRRGPLRLAMGPRFPAGLLHARRRR